MLDWFVCLVFYVMKFYALKIILRSGEVSGIHEIKDKEVYVPK